MSKSTQPSLTPDTPKAWWQKGIFSANNWFGRWFQKHVAKYFQSREEVPESALFLYKRALSDINVLGKNADLIDNEKFGNPEFLLLIKLRYLLDKNIAEYAGIKESVELIQAAIDAKDSFLAIAQTELRFRGSKQQDFYQFTEDLLKDIKSTEDFRQRTQVQVAETIAQIKTDEGRVAMQEYSAHLDRLSEKPLGLKLLGLFKAYELADLSILRQISDLIHSLNKRDLQNHTTLAPLVAANYETFEKMGQIVNLPQFRSNPDTFARMIQVLALNYKHRISFMQFDELLAVLKRWYRPYQAAIGIRETHPPHKFKQPPEFQGDILGEKTYLKYKGWLTDQKSGMVFLDFDEET
ncbi:MAG: hypothetical protein RLZZ490_892 [Cyanobacteriota bacterium]|jgi:hypothetical protein